MRPWPLAIAGGSALAAGMGLGRFAYTPMLPYMQRDLDLSLAAGGAIASANFAGYLAGALLAIRISRAARGRWYVIGLAVSVLSTLLLAVCADPWLIGALRAASGIASAFVLVHGSAIILDQLAAAGRPALFSVLYAGVGAGIVVSALLVETMSRLQAGAAAMWAAIGAAALLLALPALRIRDRPPPGAATGSIPPSGIAPVAVPGQGLVDARLRALRWLTLAYGGLGFGYVITATFIVVMVRARPDWQRHEMLVWLCVGLAGAPSNYLWLRVSQRFDPYRAMTAAYLIETVGVLCAANAQSLVLVLAGATMLGGTFMGITALGLTTARQLAPGDTGPAMGRLTAAFGAAQMLGPGLAGWIAERTGSFAMPSVLAAATLVLSAIMVARARTLSLRQS